MKYNDGLTWGCFVALLVAVLIIALAVMGFVNTVLSPILRILGGK